MIDRRNRPFSSLLLAPLLALGVASAVGLMLAARASAADTAPQASPADRAAQAAPAKTAKATFAGGCFWCMEPPFDKLDGVLSTTSGYTGGKLENPTNEQVSAGGTGHAEAVEIEYDPSRITYEKLLDVFWHNVDPTTPNRQFCDHGNQYRTAIFYHDAEQKRLAEKSKADLEASGKLPGPIVTEIVPASTFYPAEEYHQDYYEKNPIRYRYYRYRCGRDQRLEELWGTKAKE
jgi:peptide-methionine (S)-S-oxide reductase